MPVYTTPFSSSAASSDSGDRLVRKWKSRLYIKGYGGGKEQEDLAETKERE